MTFWQFEQDRGPQRRLAVSDRDAIWRRRIEELPGVLDQLGISAAADRHRPGPRGNAHSMASSRWVAALAAYMGLEPSFDACFDAVAALGARVAIPKRITDIGVARRDFQRLAVMALPDFNAGCNPRKLDVPALVSILEAASLNMISRNPQRPLARLDRRFAFSRSARLQ